MTDEVPLKPREDGDTPWAETPPDVSPGWSSPAADALTRLESEPVEHVPADPLPRSAGWFARLRSLRPLRRRAGLIASVASTEPWRSPSAAEESAGLASAALPVFIDEPDIEEPPSTPPDEDAPTPVEAPASAPAPSMWQFGRIAELAAAPVSEPIAQPSLFDAPPPAVEATDALDDPGESMPPVPPLTAAAADMPLPDPDAETPDEEAEEEREAEVILRGGPFSRFAWPSHPRYWNGYLAVLTGLATLSFLTFVLVEPSPRWILLVVALSVAAGMDGVLRATWRAAFANGEDTTPYLFLPALYVFAVPVLIEHNVSGHTVLLWALLAGAGFGAIAVAEVLSVRTGSRLYPYARTVTTAGAYVTAFALLALTYVLHLGLLPALVATWLIGTMLAIEVVREGEVDPVETVIFAALAGLVVAQVRWLLYFLPVDGYLAGLALVLVFYLVAGVLHSYVLRQLTALTAAEYVMVTIIGMVLVAAARVAGLA